MTLTAKATKISIAAVLAGAAALTTAGVAFSAVTGPTGASTPVSRTAVQLGSSDDGLRHRSGSDDRGSRVEPGDDRGMHAEPGDDRGMHAEPGDDRGTR